MGPGDTWGRPRQQSACIFFQYFAVREVEAHRKAVPCRVIPFAVCLSDFCCGFILCRAPNYSFAVLTFFAVRRQ
jgi:hypothetical protein